MGPCPTKAAGFALAYYGQVDAVVQAALDDWAARLAEGGLRRWRVDHGTGGCCIDFPASLDELGVLHAAQARYPGLKVEVGASDDPSGAFGWFRHPDLPGCVMIRQGPAFQVDLFVEGGGAHA